MLSRNIIIQSDEASNDSKIGSHIMVMNESASRGTQEMQSHAEKPNTFIIPSYNDRTLSVAHVVGVELRRMGQMGNILFIRRWLITDVVNTFETTAYIAAFKEQSMFTRRTA